MVSNKTERPRELCVYLGQSPIFYRVFELLEKRESYPGDNWVRMAESSY